MKLSTMIIVAMIVQFILFILVHENVLPASSTPKEQLIQFSDTMNFHFLALIVALAAEQIIDAINSIKPTTYEINITEEQ